MKFHRSCQSFSSVFLFIGISWALLIEVPQDSLNGTVGQSVLLSVTYKLQGSFPSPLSIQWTFSNTTNVLVTYTGTNISVSAEGIPTCHSGNVFIQPSYQGRIMFFPENASLLLQNLSLIDGGVYTVNFRLLKKTRDIALIVSAPHFNDGNPESSEPTEDDNLAIPGHPIDYIAGGCSTLLFLLLLLLCCRWHRGAAGSQTTRIIKQEQVQNPEDSLVDSTLYLEAQEHPLTRSKPETEYATIGFSVHNLA
ncbi:uncharacterized protein LOC119861910 [Dermochelys coriacea]|uniref:uncharacterized protein LOC119861910 n=1 Tax=Dermochelys coriacea TaxID=27794 RepID=UPI001CA9BB5E|nr:uncharacterized protein LOC119861910 [Dermochelys coriacea]